MSNIGTLTPMPLEGRGFVVHDTGDYRPGEFRRLNNCELLDGRIVGRRDIRSCVTDFTDLLNDDTQNYGQWAGTFNEWAVTVGPKHQFAIGTSGEVQEMWSPTELGGDYSGVYFERIVGFFKYNFNNFWINYYQRDLTSSIGIQLLYCSDLIDDQPKNYTYAGLSDNGSQIDIQLADDDFYDFRFRNFFIHKDRLWIVSNGAVYFSKATDPTLFEVVDGGGFFKFPNSNINYAFALGNTIYILADDSTYAITYTSDPNADATVRKISEVVGGMHGCVFRDTPYLINSEGIFAINNNFVTKVLDNKFDTGINNYTRQHLTAFREYLVVNKGYNQADPYHEPDGSETILRINYARNPGFKYGPKLAPRVFENTIASESYGIPTGYFERGSFYDPGTNATWRVIWNPTSNLAKIYSMDSDGVPLTSYVTLAVPSTAISVSNIIKRNNEIYILYALKDGIDVTWYLGKYSSITGLSLFGAYGVYTVPSGGTRPGLGYDSALDELLIADSNYVEGIGTIQRRSLVTPYAFTGKYELNISILDAVVTAITFIGVGNFDHSTSRVAIADQKKLWVVNKTSVSFGAVTQEDTNLKEASYAVWHDGTNFFSSAGNGFKNKYSPWHGAMDGSDRKWWVATTNSNGTDADQTVRSARSFINLTNRRFLNVEAAPKPSGYTHYAFYTGYGNANPINTAQWRQGTYQTSNSKVIGSKVTAGSNPPNNPAEATERSYDLITDLASDVYVIDGVANFYSRSASPYGIVTSCKGLALGVGTAFAVNVADLIALPKAKYTLSMKAKLEGFSFPADTVAIITVFGYKNDGTVVDFGPAGTYSADLPLNNVNYVTIKHTFTTVLADKIGYRVQFKSPSGDELPTENTDVVKIKERVLEAGDVAGTYFDGDFAASGITFYRYDDEGTLGKQMSKSSYGYFLQGLYRELNYPYFSPDLAESSGGNKLGYNTYFINMDTGAIHSVSTKNLHEGVAGYICDVVFNPEINPLTGYPSLLFMTANVDSDHANMYYYMEPEYSPLPFDTTFVGDGDVPVSIPPNYEIEFYSFTPDNNEYLVKKFRNLEIMGKFPNRSFELGIAYDNNDFVNFRDLNDPLLESQVLRPHFPHRLGLNQRGRSISYLFRTKSPFVALTDPATYDKLEFSDISLLWTPTQRAPRYSSYSSAT